MIKRREAEMNTNCPTLARTTVLAEEEEKREEYDARRLRRRVVASPNILGSGSGLGLEPALFLLCYC